jgi:LppX_LprAFG lipoprotein
MILLRRTHMRETQTILLLLWVLVSSVGVKGSQQPNPGGGTGAVQDYLNQTADAILALKSARFVVKHEGAPVFLNEKKKITFTAAACAYAAPDRVSCDVKVSLKNGSIAKVKRVWVPEGAFQTNPMTRELGKAPADANFNPVLLFAATGIPEVLRTGFQNGQVVGRERIQNRDAIHLKGEVSGEKLNPLAGSTLKPELGYPVDLWIDERSANPARIHITESEGNGWLVELFGANAPVHIPPPKPPRSRSDKP